jgi:protein arginine N-methyltransferase 3
VQTFNYHSSDCFYGFLLSHTAVPFSVLTALDNRWDDWEADEMGAEDAKCLFCAEILPSAREVFAHCSLTHGFDFLRTRQQFSLDFYQSIRLINYLRQQAQDVEGFDQTTTWTLEGNEAFLGDDEYLRPVLEDDSLLYAFEDLEVEDFAGQDHQNPSRFETTILMPQGEAKKMQRSPFEDIETTTELEARLLKQLRQAEERLFAAEVQLQNVEMQFQEYRTRVKESFFDTLVDDTRSMVSLSQREDDEDRDPKTIVVPQDEGNYYFNSYAHSDIHQQMLNVRGNNPNASLNHWKGCLRVFEQPYLIPFCFWYV